MYPISEAAKALFESQQRQVLRITHGNTEERDVTTGPASVVNVTDAMTKAALDVLVDITAIQSGSGDPSPANIRPISGHDGLTLYHSGADTSNPDVYSVAFPSEAGTVYGGTYDVTTGVLTVTHEAHVFSGNENVFIVGSGNGTYVRIQIGPNGYVRSQRGVCSHFPGANIAASNTNAGVFVQAVLKGHSMIAFRWNTDDDTNIPTTVADWQSFFAAQYEAGTPVTVVYELANPVTYNLTPQGIGLLRGVNNLWASTGMTTLRYMARDMDAIVVTDANVMTGGFSIDRYACNGERLEIGTAIAAELSLRLDNRQGQFNGITFEGTELFAEIGVADWSQASPSITWIPCGYFTPFEQPRALNTITINALDRMTLFDIAVSDGELTFPATVEGLVGQMCARCGATLAESISSLPNASYSIAALPTMEQKISYRTLLQWCAGLMGTNAWMDWNGQLRFSWFANQTGYTATTANRFDSDLYENAITITGVKYVDTDEAETVYIAGTDTYALDLSGNLLVNVDDANDILTAIYTAVHDFAYTPFLANVISAPYLWPMDRMTFTDKHGTGHVSALTGVNHKVNGRSVLQACGQTAETDRLMPPNNFTPGQQDELQRIRRANSTDVADAVAMATALITGADGGYVRFIYDADNKLTEIVIMDTEDIATAVKVWRWNSGGLGYSSNGYAGPYTTAITQNGAIVADFITTGKLNADRIYGGTLTLGGNGNVNGKLEILDASGNIIGEWNSTVFNVNTSGANGTLRLDGDGGHLSKAIIGELDCPNAAKVYTGPSAITVGTTSSTYLTLWEAFGSLSNRIVTSNITITLEADLYEVATLSGVSGSGSITINGAGYSLQGRIALLSNSQTVEVQNITLVGISTYGNVFQVSNCQFVYLHNSTINGNNSPNCVYLTASNVRMSTVEFYNSTTLISCQFVSHLLTYNLIGGNCTNFLIANGALVHMSGTRPDGAFVRDLQAITAPSDPTTLTINYGSATPIVPPTTTSTLACTASGHYWNAWESGNTIIQGRYDNAVYAGCMWFNISAISGKTVRSATLTISRLQGYGTWDNTTLYLCGTTLTGKSGNPKTNAVTYGSIGSLSEGSGGTFAIPVQAVQDLADGTIGGLMLYIASDTTNRGNIYSDNYSAYAGYGSGNAPALTVVYDS